MADSDGNGKSGKSGKLSWLWPIGVAATGLAGAALLLTRGCWHRKMSWPVRMQGCAYQVCLGCGVKRLFDETNFRPYGPFSYDVAKLVEWEKTHRPVVDQLESPKRSAS